MCTSETVVSFLVEKAPLLWSLADQKNGKEVSFVFKFRSFFTYTHPSQNHVTSFENGSAVAGIAVIALVKPKTRPERGVLCQHRGLLERRPDRNRRGALPLLASRARGCERYRD